ncbi:hypothetical protein CVT26_005671 [Gymnopilus dilepis]|uniref:Uncharacterized protein n=1 Tax=Gymnopilus dilepis TaxID=231916 RepID=A0A409X682_9AGAR|nr:hypothetical protein CVT26_005671 [Gymnopilus dilepis]
MEVAMGSGVAMAATEVREEEVVMAVAVVDVVVGVVAVAGLALRVLQGLLVKVEAVAEDSSEDGFELDHKPRFGILLRTSYSPCLLFVYTISPGSSGTLKNLCIIVHS